MHSLGKAFAEQRSAIQKPGGESQGQGSLAAANLDSAGMNEQSHMH